MGRLIGAVVAGYLVMAVCIFATFSLAYLALGAEGAFQPGTYAVSTLWVVLSLVLGFLCAFFGGWIAATIGRGFQAGRALAIVVVVLGIVFAVPVMRDRTDPGPRDANVPNMAAMQQARTPLWVALLNPLVGAVGVIVGARRKVPAA